MSLKRLLIAHYDAIIGDVYQCFTTEGLRKLDKRLLYAWLYNCDRVIRERIDEEGCGVFFAAVYHHAYNQRGKLTK